MYFRMHIQDCLIHINHAIESNAMYYNNGIRDTNEYINLHNSLIEMNTTLSKNMNVVTFLDVRRKLQSHVRRWGISDFIILMSIFMSEPVEVDSKISKHFHALSCETYHASYLDNDAVSIGTCDMKTVVCKDPILCKVHGVTLCIYSNKLKRMLCAHGYMDNIDMKLYNYTNHLTYKQHVTMTPREINSYMRSRKKFHSVITGMTIAQIIMQFNSSSMIDKFNTIITLLAEGDSTLPYILFDILRTHATISYEQQCVIRSIPLSLLTRLNTIFDQSITISSMKRAITYEQQINAMSCSKKIKRYALDKLNEIEQKNDDSAHKPRQYLEKLLRIPFEKFHRDQSVVLRDKNINLYSVIKQETNHARIMIEATTKIKQFLSECDISNALCENIIEEINNMAENEILSKKINHETYKKLQLLLEDPEYQILILKAFSIQVSDELKTYNKICKNIKLIHKNILNVEKVLDNSIYGHDKAKRNIYRILAQWINGDNTGHCFGFEGPPGVGKTSLAMHGISNCFMDITGKARPFCLIALGGSSNSSYLEGHSYTYVESSCGKILDTLIETECMNPIIFIDEIDKISQTEHGKELFGILTHLIDFTQNMHFNDKYFNGIPINLSNVLFILSYNDPKLVDPIVLDRIHRIKFEALDIENKMIIVKKYIIPKLTKKIGLCTEIQISDDTIQHIVFHYTREAGVRQLSEIFFDILSEINLQYLRGECNESVYIINKEDIDHVFLHDYDYYTKFNIIKEPTVGIANAMWTNSHIGGIMHIQSSLVTSVGFMDLQLTGLQGNVMQESMTVAKNLAWSLVTDPSATKNMILQSGKQGLHVHCPVNAMPKDGPSAGVAITMCILSTITKRPLRQDVCFTGEVNLVGDVMEVGGIELKFAGAIYEGIKTIVYPEKNQKEVDRFRKKHTHNEIVFYSVNSIKDVEKIAFS